MGDKMITGDEAAITTPRQYSHSASSKNTTAGAAMANHLDACIYCPGQRPKNRKQAKRLRDTSGNRRREIALYNALGRAMQREAEQVQCACGASIPATASRCDKCREAVGKIRDWTEVGGVQIEDGE